MENIAEEFDAPSSCPNCGKALEDWTENEGRGVTSGGVVYCSERCALEEAAHQLED